MVRPFLSLVSPTYDNPCRYEEAAHSATRALTLDPKSSEARYLRGVARLEQKLLNAAKTGLSPLDHLICS